MLDSESMSRVDLNYFNYKITEQTTLTCEASLKII